tara:strand:- start:1045 stop:1431 length:387 start_codon:yes stop_codon:yes gene_type:complete
MKWIFTLLIITPCLLYSQSANDSIKSHDIYEIGIDKLISKYESIIKNKKGTEGWRVQLGFNTKQQEIKNIKIKFMKLYPKIPSFFEYEAPYYKVRVGNCKTRMEAIKLKHSIIKDFPASYPVPSIINL